jgi:rRNA maturation endonuclease Nob1
MANEPINAIEMVVLNSWGKLYVCPLCFSNCQLEEPDGRIIYTSKFCKNCGQQLTIPERRSNESRR